jgi:hypothetical protein
LPEPEGPSRATMAPGSKARSVGAMTRTWPPAGRSKPFEMSRGLDDRRRRRGGAGSGPGRFAIGRWQAELLAPHEFVHQALVGFLGQIVEELQALVRVHLVDDGLHFIARPRVQQNVSVVVGKDAGQDSGELDGEPAEEHLLVFEGEIHEEVGGDSGTDALQQLDYLVPTALGENQPELFGNGQVHFQL